MEFKGYTKEQQPDQGGVVAPLGWRYIPLIGDYTWSVVNGAALRSAPEQDVGSSHFESRVQ
jgi:hypothetical protein